MKQKKMSRHLIVYEIRNILGNPFIPMFGIGFPVLFLLLITKAVTSEVPSEMVREVNTEVFISMSTLVPMAVILIGYGASYAQELEKGIPLRMRLFGFSDRVLFGAKLTAELLVMTAGLLLYTIVLKTEQLPKFLRIVSRLLPMSYITNDFGSFWQGGSYHFASLIQSFLFVGAVSGVILILSLRKRRS